MVLLEDSGPRSAGRRRSRPAGRFRRCCSGTRDARCSAAPPGCGAGDLGRNPALSRLRFPKASRASTSIRSASAGQRLILDGVWMGAGDVAVRDEWLLAERSQGRQRRRADHAAGSGRCPQPANGKRGTTLPARRGRRSEPLRTASPTIASLRCVACTRS